MKKQVMFGSTTAGTRDSRFETSAFQDVPSKTFQLTQKIFHGVCVATESPEIFDTLFEHLIYCMSNVVRIWWVQIELTLLALCYQESMRCFPGTGDKQKDVL